MLPRLTIFLLLSPLACTPWPDVPESEFSTSNKTWPQLMPIEQIGQSPSAEDPDAIRDELAERAARLQARATILRRSVDGEDEMEALRQRLAR